MHELDRKVGETTAQDVRPGTQEKTATGATDKRTEGRSTVGPLKTRACGAMAL